MGSGVVDVAFRGGTAYALVTGVAPDLDGHDIVGIVRYLYYYHKMVLQISEFPLIFTSVFHRILDLKTGLNFYSDPFFILCR